MPSALLLLLKAVYFLGLSAAFGWTAGWFRWPGPLWLGFPAIIVIWAIPHALAALSIDAAAALAFPLYSAANGRALTDCLLFGAMGVAFAFGTMIGHARRNVHDSPQKYDLPGWFSAGDPVPAASTHVPFSDSEILENHFFERAKMELEIRDRITESANVLLAAFALVLGGYAFLWAQYVEAWKGGTEHFIDHLTTYVGGLFVALAIIPMIITADMLIRLLYSRAYSSLADPLVLLHDHSLIRRDVVERGADAPGEIEKRTRALVIKSAALTVSQNMLLNQGRLGFRDKALKWFAIFTACVLLGFPTLKVKATELASLMDGLEALFGAL